MFLQHPCPSVALASTVWGPFLISGLLTHCLGSGSTPSPTPPSLFFALSLPGCLSPYLSLVYLCLFSRQAVCREGFTRVEVLTGWGCGEDTLCPFLSLIGRTEVTAQGSGWNFALDDLILFAGASTGTAGVKPVRKQAPACWLLLLTHSHPGSAEQVHRRQSGEGCRFPRHSQKQGLGCVCRGRWSGGGCVTHGQRARMPSLGPQEEIPRAEDEQGASPPLLPSGAPGQACPCRPMVRARKG